MPQTRRRKDIDDQIVHASVHRLRIPSIPGLEGSSGTYYSKYLAVQQLQAVAETQPDRLTSESIEAIVRLINEAEFAGHHQAVYFYRQAATVLFHFISLARHPARCKQLLHELLGLLETIPRDVHRAVTETLQTLPHAINGPVVYPLPAENPPRTTLKEILAANRLILSAPPLWMGRSLVCPIQSEAHRRVLVIKMARKAESPSVLVKEATWQTHLNRCAERLPRWFHIPVPLMMANSCLFRIKGGPVIPNPPADLDPNRFAMAYLADADYFVYPNQSHRQEYLTAEQFNQLMYRNAWLFGRLAAEGILHTAPIPLFHNRTQAERRVDAGRYRWGLGGRLDRWLNSCVHPNFGKSGIRDFEHMISLVDSFPDLSHHMGNHLIALLLVCGSYFRNKAPHRRGLDSNGDPVDTRDLFCPRQLRQLLEDIFQQYYSGFTGNSALPVMSLDLEDLTRRMIDEMGVDRHMEEVFRAADQASMTKPAFTQFLVANGVSPLTLKTTVRGQRDIRIRSGPHLGDFNGPISLPEMTRAVATVVTLCIVGHFEQNHFIPNG